MHRNIYIALAAASAMAIAGCSSAPVQPPKPEEQAVPESMYRAPVPEPVADYRGTYEGYAVRPGMSGPWMPIDEFFGGESENKLVIGDGDGTIVYNGTEEGFTYTQGIGSILLVEAQDEPAGMTYITMGDGTAELSYGSENVIVLYAAEGVEPDVLGGGDDPAS